jgi:hypothetical protein
MIEFNSSITVRGEIPDFGDNVIKNETMFFSSGLEYAYANGGPITRSLCHALPEDWQEDTVILDSRVHMLMPGWWPCIPGWHLDDVPRTRADGQPDHTDPAYEAEHLMVIIGDCSRTEFALGKIELRDPPLGEVVYGIWHPQIEQAVSSGQLSSHFADPCKLIEFNWQTFHQGKQATHNGWRFFARLSRNTKREFKNEIRRQAQVYLEIPMEGW